MRTIILAAVFLFLISLPVSALDFYAVKRANITTSSVTLTFPPSSQVVVVSDPSNSDEICIDWVGDTAVCPAANTAGDDRLPIGASITLDLTVAQMASRISLIAASGTQIVYVRALR